MVEPTIKLSAVDVKILGYLYAKRTAATVYNIARGRQNKDPRKNLPGTGLAWDTISDHCDMLAKHKLIFGIINPNPQAKARIKYQYDFSKTDFIRSILKKQLSKTNTK